jgi:signal transduction histidine kinase/CheY-like chemotaxis protein
LNDVPRTPARPTGTLVTLGLGRDEDLVAARQLARRATELLAFDGQAQVRIATAVSELVRNVLSGKGGGELALALEPALAPEALVVEIAGVRTEPSPAAPGAEADDPEAALVVARRLMGDLRVERRDDGVAVVRLRRLLPERWRGREERRAAGIREALARENRVVDAVAEVERGNRELAAALDAMRDRQEELERLNGELEDTNRGVVALYAELDERAEELKRADAMKSRFLSNMSHEFRSPLNSILAISRLLAEEADGPLGEEQRRQVGFIRAAAEDLYELVDDLLDLAKVDAGKVEVRPSLFPLGSLFGTLRGLTRPLLALERPVELVIEEPPALTLFTDEGKVGQILRNLLSNALKFTERGEVRLTARDMGGGWVSLAVADTGIGIASEDRERIFSEFGQLDTPMHRRSKGTGLGLALSARLAELLGGRIELESEPGHGSTFALVIPGLHHDALEPAAAAGPVLVVDDDAAFRYVIGDLLRRLGLAALTVADGSEAVSAFTRGRPQAVVLDLRMPGVDGFAVLDELRELPAGRTVPVVVVTSTYLDGAEMERLRSRSAPVLAKRELAGATASSRLATALREAGWLGHATTEVGR